MSAVERRAFSLGWVVVSYFLVLGGIAGALVAAVALKTHERTHAYALVAAGAAVGGLFAGRASPHRSYLEPALAGALVVGSLIAFMSRTSLAPWLYSFGKETMWREAAIVGGIALVGGLVGAVIGELSAPDEPSGNPLRWMGMAVLITAGALLASLIVSNVLMVDRALKEGGMVEMMQGKQLVTDDQLVRAVLIALAAGAFLGGLVTQAAAPRRVVLAIGIAVLVGYAAMMLGILDPRTTPLTRDTIIGIAAISVGGGVLAMIGGLIGRTLGRMTL